MENRANVVPLFSEQERTEHLAHTFAEGKSFDYSKITDEIYLGTNMCCQIGYAQELLGVGVKADISVEGERVDEPFGVDYFLWLPVTDKYPPSQSQLEVGTRTIAYFVSNHTPLYVHCKNGHGRAPTLVAAYFISTGRSVEDALSSIKEKRPVIHLTPQQEEALKIFADTNNAHR